MDDAALRRFLTTDPRDAGCGQTRDLLDAYVELVLAGDQPERRYPGIAVHLRFCPPCADDYQGLLAAARAQPPLTNRERPGRRR
jgi:hypothetical protein